jgi:hypothetical protein
MLGRVRREGQRCLELPEETSTWYGSTITSAPTRTSALCAARPDQSARTPNVPLDEGEGVGLGRVPGGRAVVSQGQRDAQHPRVTGRVIPAQVGSVKLNAEELCPAPRPRVAQGQRVVAPEDEGPQRVAVAGAPPPARLIVPIREPGVRREEQYKRTRIAVTTGGEHVAALLCNRARNEQPGVQETHARFGMRAIGRRENLARQDAAGEATEARGIATGYRSTRSTSPG